MRRIGSAVVLVLLCQGTGRSRAAPAAAAAGVPLVIVGSADAVQADVPPNGAQTGAGLSSDKFGGMSMQMTFFGGNTFHLWFNAFHVHNAGTLTAACLGVVIMAALYEGLKVTRIILVDRINSYGIGTAGYWVQVFLHMTQVAVSYFLMLAVMTYSTWMMLSVIAGAGIGYAIFANMVSAKALLGSASEHCH